MKKNKLSLDQACKIIKEGGVVAIPTETVYGLAGSAFNKKALKEIFQVKKRPLFNPLIIHCANEKQMSQFHKVRIFLLKKMVAEFSPGPLTFILEKSPKVNSLITAGQEKVGLRIPDHPLSLRLLKKTGPLCAPSANLFGKLSPTCANHVKTIFKNKVPVLDGGPSTQGIESTVIEPDFKKQSIRILRPGPISPKKLKTWLKKETKKDWKVYTSSSSLSPGHLKTHYKPLRPLVIIETTSEKKWKKIEIISILNKKFQNKIFKELKLPSSPTLAARKLYHELNTLSARPSHVIYVIKHGKERPEWQAIWDRLNKAASKLIRI